MSFIDGIATGVRAFFGIPQPRHDDAGTKPNTRTATKTAKDTKTTFESSNPRIEAPTGPSLADRVRQTQVGPHESARRDIAPPSQGLSDALNGSTQAGGQSSTESGASSTERPAPTRSSARARVFDAAQVQANGAAGFVGTTDTLDAGGRTQARVAADNVQQGLDYYATRFGRNGIDDAGSSVDVVLNDTSKDASGKELFKGNGGYYTTPTLNGGSSEAIRFGSGTEYQHMNGGKVDQASMLYAEDLTIHELTHGLIKHETGQTGGTPTESGAVNEAFADVMAASATRDWRMGESMYMADSDYRMMRNLANPDDPTAVHSLWTTMDQVRSEAARDGGKIEEHYASGVLSTTAARIQQRLGGETGWQAVEQVFYDTITDHRLGDMSFASAAQGLRATAAEQFGQQSTQYSAFDQELRSAGL